jgi:hypothetical protein
LVCVRPVLAAIGAAAAVVGAAAAVVVGVAAVAGTGAAAAPAAARVPALAHSLAGPIVRPPLLVLQLLSVLPLHLRPYVRPHSLATLIRSPLLPLRLRLRLLMLLQVFCTGNPRVHCCWCHNC